jgi:hypothetical protein
MRALTRSALAGALTAGALLASPAGAANCVGEQSLLYVCVTAPDVVTGEKPYCFYVGGDTCTRVNVPTATVQGPADVDCHGPKACELNFLAAVCEVQTLVSCKTSR